VLDYVLDVAVIHLEPDARPYSLTISNIAQCLQKTPGQLAGALDQLRRAGLINVGDQTKMRRALPETREIYPTANALKTLPYFSDWDARLLELEVQRLSLANSR
jgi:hypothetical protein